MPAWKRAIQGFTGIDPNAMDESQPTASHKPIDAAICIDRVFYQRYRAVLRHLCVGLIDVIPRVRLVSSAPEAESLSLGPVRTTVIPELRWPFRSRRERQLIEDLSKAPPTVVHAMSAGSYAVAALIATEFDADLVYQVTALEDVDILDQATHTGSRRLIATSEPLRRRAVETANIPNDQIALIRPGVICSAEPTCFCDPAREPTLLTTASFIPENALENLLNAVRQLHDRGHSFLTFLLGSGPEESKLRHAVHRLGLNSSVVFAEPQGDVLRAMIGADIFVQPAPEDSISARSLQALGQGMAVVSVTGGVHDAYIPDQTAVLVGSNAPPDLAGGIERCLMDHAYARKLAANAIAHMRANHTMTAMAEDTGELYRRMAAQRATIPIAKHKPAGP